MATADTLAARQLTAYIKEGKPLGDWHMRTLRRFAMDWQGGAGTPLFDFGSGQDPVCTARTDQGDYLRDVRYGKPELTDDPQEAKAVLEALETYFLHHSREYEPDED